MFPFLEKKGEDILIHQNVSIKTVVEISSIQQKILVISSWRGLGGDGIDYKVISYVVLYYSNSIRIYTTILYKNLIKSG